VTVLRPQDAFISSLARDDAATAPDALAPDDQSNKIDISRDRMVTDWVRVMVNEIKAKGVMLDDAFSSMAPNSVPCISSEMIDNLLREAVPRLTNNALMKVVPNSCMMGDRCIGRSPDIPGLRHGQVGPLMAWMSLEEWINMKDHGMVPTEVRRCVLCEAYNCQVKYNKARLKVPDTLMSTSDEFVMHDMQAFCVRVDEDGGYKSEYCVPFSKDGCVMASAGIISPIFMPQLSLLENRYTTAGVRYIDQSRIKHEYNDESGRYF
jgi:hypothetical protein